MPTSSLSPKTWQRAGRRSAAAAAVLTLAAVSTGLTPADATSATVQESSATAAPVTVTSTGKPLAQWGGASASFPDNVGPNTGKLPLSLQAGYTTDIGGSSVDLTSLLKMDSATGLLSSVAQSSSATSSRALSGALGENLTYPANNNPANAAHFDVLKANGAPTLPAGLVDSVNLDFGAFASESSFVNGVLQDPDGVGGPGRYTVGKADLTIVSPAVKNAAAQLYQSLGTVDRSIEQTVNQSVNLSTLNGVLGVANLPTPTMTVQSNTRDKVFAKLLAQPLTSRNKLVTIDLSTGTVAIHLDQLTAGGLNSQAPNTELVNSKDYPLIAQTVHDLMHDATNIAVGAVENSLDAVKITLNWSGPLLLQSNGLNITWSFTLQQAVTGTMPAPSNTSTGLLGSLVGSTVTALASTANVLGTVFRPAYNLIIADAGNGIFDLAINQIKFGFTSTVVGMLQPVFSLATQAVSVKVNAQDLSTCTPAGGTPVTNGQSLDALRISLLKSADGATLHLGSSAATVTPSGC